MPDATEWLLEIDDHEAAATTYDHVATREDAIAYLRQLVGQGKTATLYQRVPFTVNVDVTVKARRTRKQKASPAPAEPSVGPPPSGSEPPSAGGTKEGAASPRAVESAEAPRTSPALPTADPPASPLSLTPSRKEEASVQEGAERRPAPSPVSVWICEANFEGDPACPGPAEFDPVTRGRFCGFHLTAVPECHRREMHRLHKHRNVPIAPVARLAG